LTFSKYGLNTGGCLGIGQKYKARIFKPRWKPHIYHSRWDVADQLRQLGYAYIVRDDYTEIPAGEVPAIAAEITSSCSGTLF